MAALAQVPQIDFKLNWLVLWSCVDQLIYYGIRKVKSYSS